MFPYDRLAIASILGTSLDAVFTIDGRGVIVDTNPAALRMFGWSREELLGANISIIVPSPSRKSMTAFSGPSIRGGGSSMCWEAASA